MKLAFAVGTMVAGKRLKLSPRALAQMVSTQLENNPQFKEIGDQLRQDLRGVGKAASGALVERQIEGLAGRLHSRTQGVRDQISGVAPDVDDVRDAGERVTGTVTGTVTGRRDERDEDAYEEEDEERYEDDADAERTQSRDKDTDDGADEEADEEPKRRQSSGSRRRSRADEKPSSDEAKSPARKAPAKKAAAKRTGTAKKAAARKPAAKTAAARKTTGTVSRAAKGGSDRG
nr:DNA primase [Streptomyces sp. SID14478]